MEKSFDSFEPKKLLKFTYSIRKLAPFVAAGVMVITGLVLLLYIIDTVLVADLHVLRCHGQCVDQSNQSWTSCHATNVIKRILTPHGMIRLGELTDCDLKYGRKEHAVKSGSFGDFSAWFAIGMKEMREILARMSDKVVHVLVGKAERFTKYATIFNRFLDLQYSSDPIDLESLASDQARFCVWQSSSRPFCCAALPHRRDRNAVSSALPLWYSSLLSPQK